eukprot:gene34676-44841_t
MTSTASVLSATAKEASDITEVVVNSTPSASSAEPFRCAGFGEVSAQVESQNILIKIQNAKMESQNAKNQMRNLIICFVDVDGLFGHLLSNVNRTALSSIRQAGNAGADYIRNMDSPALQRLKLDLVQKKVQAAATTNRLLYKEIIRLYRAAEVARLFDSVQSSLDLDQLRDGSNGGEAESERTLAEEWWADY